MTHSTLSSRLFRAAAVPLMVVALGGCASSFNTDVTRFTTQLPAPQGQTFAVVATDPGLAGGLEFSLYADLVEAQMQRLGYVQGAPETADLIVGFDYGLGDGREVVRSTGFRDPFFSPWYGLHPRSRFYRNRFRGAWGFGFYDPWFGGSDVRSFTVFPSDIELQIDNRVTGERLFEGRAQAVSTSNRLQYLVPNLVEAMFTDFPGNSGETLRISIAPEKTKVRRVD